MNATVTAAGEARALLLQQSHGVLSTLSVEVPGYPFGSVVPYCLDRQGRPVILISRIAQHTRNVVADPRASLIILDRSSDDVQLNGRLTWIALVTPVPAVEVDATAERYYRYFPQSRDYHQIHDFDFFRLDGVRVRYIGGFGRIHWFGPEKVLRANPFSAGEESGMIAHMNADHVEAMRHYCRLAGVALDADTVPVMAGVDAEGFHLLLGQRVVRFVFETPVSAAHEVRERLVAMGRRPAP